MTQDPAHIATPGLTIQPPAGVAGAQFGNANRQVNQFSPTNYYSGLTYSDVKSITMDLFDSNFIRLSQQAYDIASARIGDFTDRFMEKLYSAHPEAAQKANDPDVQRIIFEAQREAACTSNPETIDLLAQMLVTRMAQDPQSLKQLVLNEAVRALPKITPRQVTMLSVVFHTFHTRLTSPAWDRPTMAEVRADLNQVLGKAEDIKASRTDITHLDYVGCANSMGDNDIFSAFTTTYTGHFTHGVTRSSIRDEWMIAFVPSPTRPDRFVVPVVCKENLGDYLATKGLKSAEEDIGNLMSAEYYSLDEISEKLGEGSPTLYQNLNTWKDTGLASLQLTSVGTAIAYSNVKRLSNFDASLDVWVN